MMTNNVTPLRLALAVALAACGGCGSSATNPPSGFGSDPPPLGFGSDDGCQAGFAPAANDWTICCPVGSPYHMGAGGCCQDAGDVSALNDSTKCCPFDMPYYDDGYCWRYDRMGDSDCDGWYDGVEADFGYDRFDPYDPPFCPDSPARICTYVVGCGWQTAKRVEQAEASDTETSDTEAEQRAQLQ